MGTNAQIKVSIEEGEDEFRAGKAIEKAFDEVERIENIFSVYRPYSEISKINKLRKNEKVIISEEAFHLIKKSLEYSNKTDGAFDITVKPLVDLWNRAKQNNKLPADEEIKSVLAHTGYKNIILDEPNHAITFTREGMALDFGAIAKGYATGRAVTILKENGIKNAVVALGGNLYCLGVKTGNEFWTIAIRHPRDRDKVFMEIKLRDRAIDTSGDYEKYFILDNKRYSHIIDPATGYPVGDKVISSTVISGDPAVSDILATSAEILGQKGLNIIESIRDIDVVVVFKQNGKFIVRTTKEINRRYAIKEEKL